MNTIKKSLFAVLLLGIFFMSPSRDILRVKTLTAQTYSMRVNCGGNSYISGGKTWQADQAYVVGSWGFVGGRTATTIDPISWTSDDALYQSERFDVTAYRFTVPNGRYGIDLFFAEINYLLPGKRVFSVRIKNALVLSNFDIYAAVGHDVALVKTFEADVSDGILDIVFEKLVELPKISAIEVWSINTGTRSVILNWDANIEFDLAGYKVYYGDASRIVKPYQHVWNNGKAIIDTIHGLIKGQTYYFAVTAYDSSNNESDYSVEVPFTILLDLPELTIISPINNQQIFGDSVIVEYSISGDVAKAARMLVTLDGVTNRMLFNLTTSGRFTIKPVTSGNHLLLMSLFDSSDNLIGTVKSVAFYVELPDTTAPAAPKNLRVIELK